MSFFLLTVFSAVCTNFSTRSAQPRLPLLLGWALSVAPLVLAVWFLAPRMSTFAAILTVLTVWMLALPIVGTVRAAIMARRGRAHD